MQFKYGYTHTKLQARIILSKNHYNSSRFLMGAHEIKQLPEDTGIEVAFWGRSNSGKSSVINVITNNFKLARVSKTPGCTRQINIFAIDDQRRLIDLPGYGYARVSEFARGHWKKILGRYLQERKALSGLVLVMDIRHAWRLEDRLQISWSLQAGMPTHILLNKAEKFSHSKSKRFLQKLKAYLDSDLVSIQLFSARQRSGTDEARMVLDTWFRYD